MEQQYITRLAEAYKRGYEKKYAGVDNAPEMKMHYFKVKEDLPRVQVVLSFLQGIVPAGQCGEKQYEEKMKRRHPLGEE